jgi:hypothetical protein
MGDQQGGNSRREKSWWDNYSEAITPVAEAAIPKIVSPFFD